MTDTKQQSPVLPWASRTFVMGILNATPDSFSGDGLAVGGDLVESALRRAAAFVEAGVDILDIGGESTRPGAEPVPATAEADRVVPVIDAVVRQFPDVIVSVDTSKAAVAAAAFDAGAHWLNDVWSLKADQEMPRLAAEREVPVVLMHNRSRPNAVIRDARIGGQYLGADYGNLMEDIASELSALAMDAEKAGVARERIILDPGIGFGKTLDLETDGRDEGTAACVAIGIARGADIVRVHDVRTTVRVARMTDAILRAPADGRESAAEASH
ncbi:MAG: dihydropteroate synthase [Pseudomonadota bacterium]